MHDAGADLWFQGDCTRVGVTDLAVILEKRQPTLAGITRRDGTMRLQYQNGVATLPSDLTHREFRMIESRKMARFGAAAIV